MKIYDRISTIANRKSYRCNDKIQSNYSMVINYIWPVNMT